MAEIAFSLTYRCELIELVLDMLGAMDSLNADFSRGLHAILHKYSNASLTKHSYSGVSNLNDGAIANNSINLADICLQ